MKLILFFSLLLLTSVTAFAQNGQGLWKTSARSSTSDGIKKSNLPLKQLVDLDLNSLESSLAPAPKRSAKVSSKTIIQLPDGEGKLEKFRIYENSIMAPELAAKYPEIKSYYGVGVEN